MYTIYNPNPSMMMAQQQMPVAGQVYYTQMPGMPTYFVNGPPAAMPVGQGQPVFYPPQIPGWFPVSQTSNSSTSDDDVFIHDSPSSEPSVCESVPVPAKKTKVAECQTDESYVKRLKMSSKTRRKLANTSLPAGSSSHGYPGSEESLSNSDSSSRTGSPLGQQASLEENSLDITRPSFIPSSRTNANQTRINNDLTLYDVFSASLCSAINEDPADPRSLTADDFPSLKTSSPIQEEQEESQTSRLIDITQLKNARNRLLTSVSSGRCPRFSQNGWEVEMESEPQNGASLEIKDSVGTRREDFLKILEQEREKQKKCILPKYAPKMNCKFCKNNGEPPEVYSKHRLHFNEKTVCPLLRHYVCRLCNSTGDFAHTIKHCPFNSRYDKLAWKATFI